MSEVEEEPVDIPEEQPEDTPASPPKPESVAGTETALVPVEDGSRQLALNDKVGHLMSKLEPLESELGEEYTKKLTLGLDSAMGQVRNMLLSGDM